MDLPFATGYYIDETLESAAVECSNVIPEFYQVDGTQRSKLRSPPGIELFTTAGIKSSRGAWVMDELAYEVAGTTLYRVDSDGTVTSLGTITGAGRVSMADNGTQLCIVVPGVIGYIYTVAGGLVAITDTDYTANPSLQVAFKDGYFNHVTDTQFFKSALNDGLSYDPLDFAAAEVLPDKITSIHVSRNQLYIGGVETIEPFQNVGGSGFPYQRINGAVVPMGVKAKFSLVEFARTFAFVGNARNEQPSVYLYTGSTPERIATNAIDLIIEDHTDTEQKAIFCTTYSERGGFFLNVHFKDRVMTYDRQTGLWHERKSKDIHGQQTNWRVNNIVTAYGKTLCFDNQSGKVGVFNKDINTEYGETVKRVFSTIPFSNVGNRVNFSNMEITMATGTDTLTVNSGVQGDVLTTAAEDFTDPVWVAFGTPVITGSVAVAPDGTTTADSVEDDNAALAEATRQTAATTENTLTYSVFVKKDEDETRFPRLECSFLSGSTISITINTKTGESVYLSTLSPTDVTADVIDYSSEYWRVRVTMTNSISSTSATIRIFPAAHTSLSTGGAASATGSIIVWGATITVGSTLHPYKALSFIAPEIIREFSDDGHTFSNATSRSLGKEGQYKIRQIWRREGQARSHRMYRFTHDSDSKYTVFGLSGDVQ